MNNMLPIGMPRSVLVSTFIGDDTVTEMNEIKIIKISRGMKNFLYGNIRRIKSI